jgi:membrane protease YdiL (CAAX protease family)
MLVWLGSIGMVIGFSLVALFVYLVIKWIQGRIPTQSEIFQDPLFIILEIASTFPAHILTLMLCWWVVTGFGRRPFWQSLGWGWHPQFKWVHAVALAFLMLGLGYLLDKSLPSQQTAFEKILGLGLTVRLLVAALAVLTAPLVEEVVYRGVLYTGIERAWGKGGAVFLVTVLFAGVHYWQYSESIAHLTAILSLSLVLTLLRAATGKLLPCVATHMIYNGLQAIALIAVPDQIIDGTSVNSALIMVLQSLGLNLIVL